MAPKARKKCLTIIAAGLVCTQGLKLTGENAADMQELSETMFANSQYV